MSNANRANMALSPRHPGDAPDPCGIRSRLKERANPWTWASKQLELQAAYVLGQQSVLKFLHENIVVHHAGSPNPTTLNGTL